MAGPCRGGLCHFAWLHDRVRKRRLGAVSRSLNPSVGVRRQLPLHKGAEIWKENLEMDRVLIRDEKTGLMISVPADKLPQKEERKLSPEAERKFREAWERTRRRIYGK